MMPVRLQPEPPNFDVQVREPGQKWLKDKAWALDAPPPNPSDLPSYWRETQKDLWAAYSGVCAYLSIYFEWATGASSTDHFVAKSANSGQAYEWANFRLSCLSLNRNKGRFDDVLDPFEMAPSTFELNLANGELTLRQQLRANAVECELALATIQRLKLNEPEVAAMRAVHISDYFRRHVSADYLGRKSPFVWSELVRQGLIVPPG